MRKREKRGQCECVDCMRVVSVDRVRLWDCSYDVSVHVWMMGGCMGECMGECVVGCHVWVSV